MDNVILAIETALGGNMSAVVLVPGLPSYTPRYHLTVVEDGALVGYVYVYIIGDPVRQGKWYALIDDLFVEEAGRGKGYGRRLMVAAEELARKQKCYKIVANSHRKRKAARVLYASLGYVPHGREFRLDLK